MKGCHLTELEFTLNLGFVITNPGRNPGEAGDEDYYGLFPEGQSESSAGVRMGGDFLFMGEEQ